MTKFYIRKSWFGMPGEVAHGLNPSRVAAQASAAAATQPGTGAANEGTGAAQGGSYFPNWSTNKMRRVARDGYGDQGEWQRDVTRLFRERTSDRPPPHVVTLSDVTKNLGLLNTTEAKIQNLIRDTNAEFGQGSQLRTPRLPWARKQLMDVMRSDQEINGDVRREIARRAMVWWKDNVVTDMAGTKPKIRAVISKAQAQSRRLVKAAFPPKKEEEPEAKGPPQRGASPKAPQPGQPGAVKPGMVPPPEMKMGPDKKPKKPRPQLEGMQHEEYEDEGEEDEFGNKEVDKGQRIQFHDDVHAHLPENADYHHHVTEHAKHAQMYQVLKEQDPKKAEAHRHAANLHAKIGNALHAAGETEKDHGKPSPEEMQQNDPLGSFQDPYAPDPNVPSGAPGAPQGPPGAPGAAGAAGVGGGGVDALGRPQPGAPDGQRNAPGRDSAVEAKQRAAQKIKLQGPPSKATADGKGGDDDKKGGKPFGKSPFYVAPIHRTGVPYSFLIED